ncbi:MAG: hypothetical protein COW03_11835 [Cytophagales bacterium CG12_big_fil_rev_8_21_14_0_65_40_12]|nr:MAG: hypothetical protein COW03_11835 [Cytophagales bacterium CG12_big_fil_rev_8_21_14_0_65_40_12]PIW04989.1 MAG: hypothetical protein COW40_06930 [Cytophagales bacterium CG17_big_fil_post_rev_8_21_14_2_50_40_13]
MKKMTLLLALAIASVSLNAQTDWSKVDFVKKYKVQTKIPGGVAKSLKSEPTFLNDYSITQASLMKGTSQAGMMQKQGVGSVFSEAALAGVSADALQKLIDELHAEFVTELKAIGLNITDGQEVIDNSNASGKADRKNAMIGKTDGKVVYDKTNVLDNTPDIKEQNIFRPRDKNVFLTTAKVPGNFYNNEAKKANVNMISIKYLVRFASFEGSKSMTKNKLTTTAGLSILPTISIINPKAAWGWIEFNKPIDGNNDWSKGLVETDSRDGSFWGLSSKGEYSIHADEAKYIEELRQIVLNAQKAIVAQIKANL